MLNRWLLSILQLLAMPVVLMGNELPEGKDCMEFMVGVTGIHAHIIGGTLRVTKVTPGTPADGKLKKGDELEAVNDVSLKIQDPRHPLGFAINAAEGRDGQLNFSIRRNELQQSVTIKLDPIGSYSPTYPLNCKKSQRIVDETAAFIVKQIGSGESITGNLEGLFLLSTGEKKYLPAIEKYALKLAAADPGKSVWYLGYSGIFLGEYYLATGDKRVLPAIQTRCEILSAGQYYGGWSHDARNCVPGYVTGGLVNAAGVQALTTMVLARECGVKFNEKAYDNALRQFFRFGGRGGVPYGDHLPELWSSSNGKSGGLAAALTLLPDRKFQAAAQLLALSETDSYFDTETGHGSIFGNQSWRNIVDALVPEQHQDSYRRHKDKMIWYFELSRMPGGGFRTPWYPGHGTIGQAPQYQTGIVAMAYTAHLKKLRICGKPRTVFSVPYQPTVMEQSLATDDFHRTDFIDGVVIKDEPHQIAAMFAKGGNPANNSEKNQKMPVEWYAKIMRHYSPTFRVWAAHGLGFQGEAAIPEITKALASSDGRLRVAGLDAISCTTGWSVGKTVSKITPEMITAHFLPQICKPLQDPRGSMWEKRYALMALSCCDGKTIAAKLDLIKPYLDDEEWWLRTAAFAALNPLIQDTATFRSVLPAMLASYDADTNLPSRRWGATSMFKVAIEKNPALKDEIVAGMAASVMRIKIRPGFLQPIDITNIYETLRYVNLNKNPENIIPLLPAIERFYPEMEGAFARWTIVGEGWGNLGLAEAAARLGKDAKPIIVTMKRIQPNLESREKTPKDGPAFQKAIDMLKDSVKKYEDKFGEVEID